MQTSSVVVVTLLLLVVQFKPIICTTYVNDVDFRIEHKKSLKCLDVANNQAMNILIYECRNDTDSQLWNILEGDKLQSKMYPNMCITYTGNNEIYLIPCDYKSAFEPLEQQIGLFRRLRVKDTSRCLESANGLADNANKIIASSCGRDSEENQLFKLKLEA